MLQTPTSLPPSRPIDILNSLLSKPTLPNAPTHQLTTLINYDQLQPSSSPGATSNHMMFLKTIFSNHFNSILVSYLDGILIFSRTWDNHLQPNKQTLQLFRDQNIQIKEKISYLLQHSVQQLVQHSIQHSLQHSVQPSVQHSVQHSFLSDFKFCNHFSLHSSHFNSPIHQLSNRSSTFIFTNKYTSYFVQLQEKLFSSPIVHWANLSQPFKIATNASQNVMGSKIKQRGHKIVYHLEKKKLADKKMPTASQTKVVSSERYVNTFAYQVTSSQTNNFLCATH